MFAKPPGRSQILKEIQSQDNYEFIIIGGGATGLGIAQEAVLRGYKVLLLEAHDFAKGTSSRSTKLVHGGVRYLGRGNVGLVKEACHERYLLLNNAPHLVSRQAFIVPVYSSWEKIKYTIGLKIYDAMAGKEGLGKSEFITRNEMLAKLPGLKTEGLMGGILYYDGQFNDAGLAINLLQHILKEGGHILNYAKVTELQKDGEGLLNGIVFCDNESGEKHAVKGKFIINATGVFADEILQMDQPMGKKLLAISQGVHIVVDKKFLPGTEALMIPKTRDGRVLFLLPWQNKVIIGTTDIPVVDNLLEPVPMKSEISFILETVAAYLSNPPKKQDIQSVFAGLRPLAAPGNGEEKTKEISRSHRIVESQSGLFTMLGGKWTTFRKMGEDMVDKVEKLRRLTKTKCISSSYKLSPAESFESNELEARVRYAVEHEMARTVEDFLARRSRMLFLDAKKAIELAPLVAKIMAVLLYKDEIWEERQVEDFKAVASNYLIGSY